MPEIPQIDPQQVRGLALSGATDGEVADFFSITVEVLRQNFGAILVQARAARRISLRKRQTVVAADGSVPMLTFLGKHELGQIDRVIHDDDRPEPQMDPKVG
jgi:hypothetical protein